jgi:SAM-dependent methyltransferase
MKERLLDFLACPDCGASLTCRPSRSEDGEILEGRLTCQGCGTSHPVEGGVPRFVKKKELPRADAATARKFGTQWNLYRWEASPIQEKQFQDWIQPTTPGDFQGKVVLDGGCGQGRHAALALRYGAREVVGVDISNAVDAAFAQLRRFPNAHVVQADLSRLPFRPAFDYVYTIGVLHHMAEPQQGFQGLVRALKPSGGLLAWVYGRENNGWVVCLVNPLRILLTSRMPVWFLKVVSFLFTLVLHPIIKVIYLPLKRGAPALWRLLFYRDYLTYIATFRFREIYLIVFDHLNAPVAHYVAREEFERWFKEAKLTAVQIAWHNRNSWRGFAMHPGAQRLPS